MNTDDIIRWAAAAAAAVYCLKLLRAAVHRLDRLDKLTSKELEHNHGSSIKDDVHGIAVAIGTLQRSHDILRRDFDQHINERPRAS